MSRYANGPWKKCRVKALSAKIGSGKTPVGGSEFYKDEGIVFLRSQNVHSGGLCLDDVAYIDQATHREMRSSWVQDGDVLLNITGASLGRVAQIPSGFGHANVNQHVCIIRPACQTDSRFMAYALSALGVQEQIASLQVGGNRDGLNFEQVGNLEILAPPYGEQQRIADFLDTRLRGLAEIERRRLAQLAALDERALAEISETVMPGILKGPSGRNPMPWIPELPADVPLVRLGYVCSLQSGLTVDGSRATNGDVVSRPYLRVANVQAGYLSLESVTEITVPRTLADRSTLRSGDVLMTEGGDLDKLGRGAIWRGELEGCLHQNHIFALRPDSDRLDVEYLSLVTQSLHGRCYFGSTGVRTTNLASTNSSKILGFPLPLPSLDKQRAKVRALRRSSDSVERVRGLIDRQVKRLREHRQAIVTAAVTGEIDATTGRAVGA